jgi:hypothetical protein
MSEVEIRRARPDDVAFLAWVMQEADRMGGLTSSIDLTFDVGEDRRLAFLARLADSDQDSYYHYRRFLIALVDGIPAASLSGYVPDELPEGAFGSGRAAGGSSRWMATGVGREGAVR